MDGLVRQLLADNQRLQAENDSLRQQVALLQDQLRQLQLRLDQAQRESKRQAAPFRKGPPKPDPQTPGRKSGDDHGRHGHRPPPAPEQISQTLDAPLPPACPGCGGSVVEAEVVSQYQTEIPRQPILRHFTIHVGHCAGCGQRVQGRHPLQTSDALGAAASQLGPDAQAAVVHLNKDAGLSHGKVAAVFDLLFGIVLTRGASAQIVLRAAERLAPAHDEILQEIRQAERLAVDETGWRIGGHPAWLHAWVGEQATAYAIDPRRSADALEQVIGLTWEGTLGHDGFASYDRFTEATHQQCVDHVLRRARGLLETAVGGAVHFPQAVIALFTEAVHRRNECLAGRLAEEQLADEREEFQERLRALVERPRIVPAYETLAKHLENHLGSWFPFLTDVKIPATNWEAEQAIRPAVVNRKVWGGNRTEAGGAAQGVLMSVLRTCGQQAIRTIEFVSETLRAFGNPLLPQPTLFEGR